MSVFLDGIAAQFYRGIGANVQFIGPFSRMNFFIGANNAGKSIVLGLLAEQLKQVLSGQNNKPLNGPELHRGRETGQFMMAVGRRFELVLKSMNKLQEGRYFEAQYGGHPRPTFLSQAEAVLRKIAQLDQIWTTPNGRNVPQIYPFVDIKEAKHWIHEWKAVWRALHPGRDGGDFTHWISETLNMVAQHAVPTLPNIHLVPAKRVIGNRNEAFEDLSGKGLIDHLASLQQPNWDKQDDREKFRRINYFLQEVTGKPNATLEVPHGREHLLVHMDNKVLPIASLGTGIHEVVLIAAFCTIFDESIMCIEEPEIHLHPLLQRKLVRYLMANTSSQYFIATHSAAFIDTPEANIFHVANDGEQTRIRAALTRNPQRAILDELGCQASDILQANSVIWAEGPSDRIYLNHWIKAADGELVEGIHYTIMYYGGALIRHLTASDEAVSNFVRLRELNRNMAIIIDSDRETAASDLKPHAQRLLDEVKKGGGFVWITAGREVENYIDGAKMQEKIKALHPKLFVAEGKTGQYDHAFYFFRDDPKQPGRRSTYKDADKVGAAIMICQDEANLDVLDLRARILELASFIRKANGLS